MESKGLQPTPDLEPDREEIEIIAVHTICRLCASQNDRLIGIFSEEGVSNDLAAKINTYLPMKVSAGDELPLQCCWNCASTILAWHELVLTTVETDRKFQVSQFITEKHVLDEAAYDAGANPPSDNEGSKDELTSDELTPRPSSAEPPGSCDICHKTLSRPRDLKRHKASCHPKPVEDDLQVKRKRYRRRNADIIARFFCDLCDKGFTRKYDMEKHRGRLHGAATDASRRRDVELLRTCRRRDAGGKASYECDFCRRVFAQSYNLMRHRTIHTGVRAYFCHICGKSFRMSNGLSRHIDAFHRGVRKFRCEVCGRAFTARATRDEHMNIHTDNRPFVCDVCGKSFKQKASLHVHKMFHSDVYRFQCNSCGKRFRRAQDLKVHSWLHTGHRPHSCSKCKASFRLGHDLKRHLRVHEKSGECVCNDCGSVFSHERYLKAHKKIHNRSDPVVKIEDCV